MLVWNMSKPNFEFSCLKKLDTWTSPASLSIMSGSSSKKKKQDLWRFPFRHRATPSHHPFRTMGFSIFKTNYFGVPPWRAGNPLIVHPPMTQDISDTFWPACDVKVLQNQFSLWPAEDMASVKSPMRSNWKKDEKGWHMGKKTIKHLLFRIVYIGSNGFSGNHHYPEGLGSVV